MDIVYIYQNTSRYNNIYIKLRIVNSNDNYKVNVLKKGLAKCLEYDRLINAFAG